MKKMRDEILCPFIFQGKFTEKIFQRVLIPQNSNHGLGSRTHCSLVERWS